jgi:hypothetical protein
MDYLVVNHGECFDDSLHMPPEDYNEESRRPLFLSSRLKQRNVQAQKNVSKVMEGVDEDRIGDDLKQIILPKDRPDLTDFIDCVMSQVIVCRATVEDMAKKTRRVQVGHPGLVCRHCLGRGGEGKYFFSSIESLTTAATVVEKHIAKCPHIAPEVKSRMVRCKARHPEQRKNMPQGAQGAFFGRLWERLRASRATAGAEADMYVTFSTSSGYQTGGSMDEASSDEVAAAGSSDSQVEFKSHVSLMKFLQTSAPWKDKPDLQDAIAQYYNCLDYGGRIFNTNAMPPHFSSEWLLAKIAPRGRTGNR